MSEEGAFAHHKDRIALAILALLIIWLAYLTYGYASLPSKTSKMIEDRPSHTQDLGLIEDRIDNLERDVTKMNTAQAQHTEEVTILRLEVTKLVAGLGQEKKHTSEGLEQKEQKAKDLDLP